MRKETADKLNRLGTTTPFTEPHQSFARTKTGASAVTTGGNQQPVDKTLGHPHSNLGKFLHPKKSGYTPNLGKPASGVNNTTDAHTSGARVRVTQ